MAPARETAGDLIAQVVPALEELDREAGLLVALAGGTHDGDDLLDAGRIGRIAPPLVRGRPALVER